MCLQISSTAARQAAQLICMYLRKCIRLMGFKEAPRYLIVVAFSDLSWLDSILNAAMFTAGMNVNTST